MIYNTTNFHQRLAYSGPTIREVLGIGNTPVVVHSGSIRAGRGVHLVIEAMANIPDMHLALISEIETDYLRSCIDRAKELGVRERISILPYLPPENVAAFVSDADVGVIPVERYGNAEVGLANKLFDYLLAGIPIVSSNTLAMQEFMKNWAIGELFAAGDARDLEAALKTVLASKKTYSDAIREDASRLWSYSWERQAEKLAEVYSLLDHEPSR